MPSSYKRHLVVQNARQHHGGTTPTGEDMERATRFQPMIHNQIYDWLVLEVHLWRVLLVNGFLSYRANEGTQLNWRSL